MDLYPREDLRKEAEALPPLRVDGGYYPVDVEATLRTGYVTYSGFVENQEGTDDGTNQDDPG